jgi:hypothetical protein
MIAGVIAGLTGCKPAKPQTSGEQPNSGQSTSGQSTAERSIAEQRTSTPEVKEVIDPSGNSGSLSIGLNSFLSGSGSAQCFPTSQGWDKYYPMPKFFLGPNVTPAANTYTNELNIPNVTVKTCDPTNGTTLQTGILIQDAANPNDKVCVTNSCEDAGNAMLTVNRRSTQSGKKYKATIFYKSSTLDPSRTNVVVNWIYQ